jgi:hypothetical protein
MAHPLKVEQGPHVHGPVPGPVWAVRDDPTPDGSGGGTGR